MDNIIVPVLELNDDKRAKVFGIFWNTPEEELYNYAS